MLITNRPLTRRTPNSKPNPVAKTDSVTLSGATPGLYPQSGESVSQWRRPTIAWGAALGGLAALTAPKLGLWSLPVAAAGGAAVGAASGALLSGIDQGELKSDYLRLGAELGSELAVLTSVAGLGAHHLATPILSVPAGVALGAGIGWYFSQFLNQHDDG